MRLKKLALDLEKAEQFSQPSAEETNLIHLLNILRDDLKGEYNAIQQYENHILLLEDGYVKERLLEISRDELHHVDELTEIINHLENKLKDI